MEGFELTFLAALAGGAISFLSPCVLPLVPAYLSYATGHTLEELGGEGAGDRSMAVHMAVSATVFVLGFTAVFVMLGASASAVSRLLVSHLDVLAKIAGVVIVIFGLHYMGALRISLLNREARFQIRAVPKGLPGAFILGVAFAFGWTPCIGPILGAILTMAAGHESVAYGSGLLAVYSMGLGIPFIAVAMGMARFTALSRWARPNMRKIEIGAGLLLVVTGVMIFFGSLQVFGFYLIELFPWLAEIG